jgi:hypothetical protein
MVTSGPLHTRDWEPMTIALQALSLVEKVEPVQVRFTPRSRDQLSKWMQDGCKVYLDSYMASNGACFMVTWTIFQNQYFDVGLTQKHWETMALKTLTTVWVILFYCIWRPAWIEMHWNNISFGWVTLSWLRLLACVWSGPRYRRAWDNEGERERETPWIKCVESMWRGVTFASKFGVKPT